MRFLSLCTCVMCFACTFGCGPATAIIDGKVTFNGQPVDRGMINFEPVDGKGAVAGATVDNGTFHVENVAPGEKTVRIMAVYVKGIQKESDGSEIEICDDLLPKKWGLESKETIIVNPPRMDLEYNIEGPDPRSAKAKP